MKLSNEIKQSAKQAAFYRFDAADEF